jgi:NHL repeat
MRSSLTLDLKRPASIAAAAAASVLLLAGCSGGSSTGALAGGAPLTPSAAHSQLLPPPCTVPSVWVSTLAGTPPGVQGYTSLGAPCGPLVTGSTSPGGALVAPFGLATDPQGNLYVADVNMSRVLVFKKTGVYLSTLTMLPGMQPLSVCVGPKSIIGVVDRPASSTGSGDVEFFKSYNAPAPYGQTTGVLNTFNWCAFDKKFNFFADGTTQYSGGSSKIVYLPKANVLAGGPQTAIDSNLGSANYWMGMYVQKGFQHKLSVAVPGSAPYIKNFPITIAGVPVAAGSTTTTLGGYTPSADDVYEAAPSAGGAGATVYVADYLAGIVWATPVGAAQVGGTSLSWVSQATPVGVATYPTGQF